MKTFLCSHLVTVRWSNRETVANLERISPAVATINSEDPLPVGAPATLSTPDCELRGAVTSCTLDLSGYEIDITLDEPWSLASFSPDHLFDPSTCA